MYLQFKKVTLHNFLSYGHAEISLQDKGYCVVTGINNCPDDNSLSNGSGKSSWPSAICWALTGQTIQGVTQQIKNIRVDEKSCYVCVELRINNDDYIITRSKEPKADLKIVINGEDKSGKGLRESEVLLEQYLPDLTPSLIASIIILGQGLPGKFSNNTPSGRKEVLEKLSKSDFMISDLKTRIASRIDTLNTKKRTLEDLILTASSKKDIIENQLKKSKEDLVELEKPHNFDEGIQKLNDSMTTLNSLISEHVNVIKTKTEQMNALNISLTNIFQEKTDNLKEENDDFNSFNEEYLKRKSDLDSEIRTLQAEVARVKAIKDVCPTCGQKLPNVIKPNTATQEAQINILENSRKILMEKYSSAKGIHDNILSETENQYKEKISSIKNQITAISAELSKSQTAKMLDEGRLLSTRQALTKLEAEQSNYIKNLQKLKDSIISYESSIKILETELLYNNTEKDNLSNHLDVINQMNTLIKRDFRGVLLSNVISFINTKAKEYSKIVFGNDKFDFKLDGNDVDIVYCDKIFESLSGGEKQKIDLILQFAIRDMMSNYLNFSSNILILDEITDNLDAVGCTNILNLIANKMNDVESIFLISHHAGDLQIPADSEMTVVKNKDGISSIL